MKTFTPLDFLIIVIISVPIVIGLVRGFFRAILGLLGVITGIALAIAFSRPWGNQVAFWLKMQDPFAARIILFIGIFGACYLAAVFTAMILRRILKAIQLSWLDRLIGGAFGAVKGMIIVGVLILIMTSIPALTPLTEESRLAKPMFRTMQSLYQSLPTLWQSYLDPARWLGSSRPQVIPVRTGPQKRLPAEKPVGLKQPPPGASPAEKTSGLE